MSMESITLKRKDANNFYLQEAYKTLRTNLQFCGQDVKVIAITSCDENEGKSTVSMNVAVSLAEIGKKVLFLDADMRKSMTVARMTDSRNLDGLSEVLTGQKPLSQCVYECQHPNLHLLFAGKYPPNPAELLSGEYFQVLLENSRKAYDYVIIDTPPLGRVIDAAAVAANCDGVALVIGSDKITHRAVKSVVAQLNKSGCRILGVIRNFVSARSKHYYKYY